MDVGEDLPDEGGFVGAELNALPRDAEPLVVRLLGGRVAERLGARFAGLGRGVDQHGHGCSATPEMASHCV